MTGYKPHARLLYRLFAWGLSVVSPVKPLFRLALKVLTGRKRSIRGHILPVNANLGQPVQTQLSRELLVELINRSTAVGAMHECLCRAVGGCEEFPKDLGCLVLGQSVLSLHPGLGREISREEAAAVVDRAFALNLSPMVVHFKGDALLWSLEHNKMLTICFCCPCHCMLRDALTMRGVGGSRMTGLSGITIDYHERLCVNCGQCADACVTTAINLVNEIPVIDPDLCVRCGRCAMACPSGALSVQADSEANAGQLIQEYSSRTANKSVFH